MNSTPFWASEPTLEMNLLSTFSTFKGVNKNKYFFLNNSTFEVTLYI